MISLVKTIYMKIAHFCLLLLLGSYSFTVSAASNTHNEVAVLSLITSDSGMHRISHEELMSLGFDLSGLRHNRLAIVDESGPVSVRTKGQDSTFGPSSRFGPGGFIEFYASRVNDLYNVERSFTLVYDKQFRKSMGGDRTRVKNNIPLDQDYITHKRIEQNEYYESASPSKTDPWVYLLPLRITNAPEDGGQFPSMEIRFDANGIIGDSLSLSIELHGMTAFPTGGNDHQVAFSLNGIELEDEQFDGSVVHSVEFEGLPGEDIENQLVLSLKPLVEHPADVVRLNHIDLRYRKSAVAENNYLQGGFTGRQAVVSGLVGNNFNVYRVEEDGGVFHMKNSQVDGNSVKFATPVSSEYAIVGDDAYFSPVAKALPAPIDIQSGNAEYLILTNAAFKGPELDALVQLRSVDYEVKVVDVAQIYAQYGNGLPTAKAIQAYISDSVENRGTRFVTLVGSDTYDYKGYGNSGSISFVPTKYVKTSAGLLDVHQTPSDAAYGDLDNDGVPEVAVGRISVRTRAELALVLEKIQDYQAREGYAGRIVFAADKEDLGAGKNFTNDVEEMIAVIPDDWRGAIREDFRAFPDVDGDGLARDKLIAAINAGVSVTGYVGHSGQWDWTTSRSNPILFRTGDIANLTNIDKPTLVTQWGCWNTYFVDPRGNTMADHFLVGGTGGAVAVLGASTLTSADHERVLGIELSKRMYIEGKPIGEALIEAKQAFAQVYPNASDILLGWQIIGDPAIVINY